MRHFISILTLLALTTVGLVYAETQAQEPPKLSTQAQNTLQNTYVFLIDPATPKYEVRSIAAQAVSAAGGELRHGFSEAFLGFSATLPAGAAGALLSNNPNIVGFQKVSLVYPTGPGGTKGPPEGGGGGGGGGGDDSCKGGPKKCPPAEEEPPAELLPASIDCDASMSEINAAWGVDHIDADAVWDDTDPTTCGDGINLFIIDFGLDVDHDDFQPIESTWTCDHGGCAAGITAQPDVDAYSPGEPDEHGTFVTGIAAARADGALMVGVAPSARLHIYNIMETTPYGAICLGVTCFSAGLPRGFSDSLLAAIDHILANNDAAELDGRAVVNMSFMVDTIGSGSCPYAGEDLLRTSICAGVDAGMVFVSSVADVSGVHYPPATYDSVVAVGSSGYEGGQDFLSDYTGHSGLNEIDPVIDAAAPGEEITSTFPGDDTFTLTYDMSGSSYAAPHVSGALVLCLAAASNLEGDGDTVSSQIHSLLPGVLDPDPIGKENFPLVQSRGVINVPDLVTACGAL